MEKCKTQRSPIHATQRIKVIPFSITNALYKTSYILISNGKLLNVKTQSSIRSHFIYRSNSSSRAMARQKVDDQLRIQPPAPTADPRHQRRKPPAADTYHYLLTPTTSGGHQPTLEVHGSPIHCLSPAAYLVVLFAILSPNYIPGCAGFSHYVHFFGVYLITSL